MNKKYFAALAALVLIAPAAPLFAEAPAEGAEAPPKAQEKKAPLVELLKTADSNNDQKLDLAEIHAKAPKFPAERFSTLDKNQDGFLDASEIPQHTKKEAGGAGRGEVGKRLRAADTDQDGKLSQAEFTAGFPNAPAERFATMDRNSDGFVDKSDREGLDEAASAKKKEKGEGGKKKAAAKPAESAEYIKGLIAEHDADKDGKLTKAELEAAKPGFPEKNFGAMDRDQDGALSDADLVPAAK